MSHVSQPILRIGHALRRFRSRAFFAGLSPVDGVPHFGGPLRRPAQDQRRSTDNSQQKSTEARRLPPAGRKTTSVPTPSPRKKREPPPPPPPERPKKIEGMPDYSIHVDVPLVKVPVLVTTKDGQFIPRLKQDNFPRLRRWRRAERMQTSGSRKRPLRRFCWWNSRPPITPHGMDALRASYTFASTLKKEDWVAVVSYDMKPTCWWTSPRTSERQSGALNGLRMSGLFGNQYVRRSLRHAGPAGRIEGHKYIILVSTGFDSFRADLVDQILKKVKDHRTT